MSSRYTGGLVYNPPGGWSGSFSGTGQYLTLPSNSAFSFGTGDFTVECWAYFTSVANFPTLTDSRANTSSTAGFNLGLSSAKVQLYTTSQLLIGATTLAVNTWYHIAITRSGTTLRIWLNGFQDATTSNSTNWSDTTFVIGATPNFVNLMTGYISNVRVVKGTAVYTNAFTPPTGALLPITNTSLLTCRYPTFVDGSTNNFTVTNVGTVTAITANPFPTSVLPNPALGNAGNGIYTLSQYAYLLNAGTWPAYDPYYENVTLNLHGNAGAVLPFNTDASTNNFQVTQVGDTRPSNYTPFQGNGYYSNYFSSVSDYLGFSTISLGSSYTIEFFVNFPTAPSSNNVIISNVAGGGGTNWIGITSSTLTFSYGGTNRTFSFTAVAGTWYYVQVIGTASTVNAYVNGSQIGTTQTGPTSFTVDRIGGYPSVGLVGYLSNLRVTNAANAVSATPTTPLTAITNCVLLTCQSNRFVDNSASPYTLTPAGSVSVNPLQPFATTSGISAYGSGYFDGSGDCLNAPDNAAFDFGSGDFTVEGWMYPTATGSFLGFFCKRSVNSNYSPVAILTNSGAMQLFASTSGSSWAVAATASTNPVLNTWNHVAAVRNGSTYTMYLNGVSVASGSLGSSALMTNTAPFTIGADAANATGGFAGYISNMRVIKGTAIYTSAFTPPTAPLTAITNTSLLTVQTNAPSQNNTFLDSSANNFAITRNGNTTQGTFTPYGSTWSNYFDGSGDYLTTPQNAAFNIGTGQFTVEAWVYWNGTTIGAGGYGIISLGNGANGGSPVTYVGWTIQINFDTGGKPTWYRYDGTEYTYASSVNLPSNQWVHLAVSRNSSNTLSLWMNGVRVYTGTVTTSFNNVNSDPLNIGYRFDGGGGGSVKYFPGYISNARVVVGTDVYGAANSTITVPTSPLTAITNTVFLTCQSNRFIDNSTNNFTITKYGDTSVQRFSPFSPTSAYTTSVIGGSGYFDGSGDSLKIAYGPQMNLTNQDFAIELWVYLPAQLSNRSMLCQDQSNYQLNFYVDSGGNLTFYSYQASGTENFNVPMGATPVGAWTHLVIARTGSTVAGFRNGTRIATATFAGSIDAQTGGWYIGAVYSNINQITGYLSDVRFVIGSNPYGVGTTLTVPTAPLTAITNTQLLTSFTNASIFDNAMMNDLETVGNAQISTSVKKYGSASMYFDGSGDYLLAKSNDVFNFGTGNFTVEFWINASASGSYTQVIGTIVSSAEAGTWRIGNRFNSANQVYFARGTGSGFNEFQANVNVNDGAWHHVAVVRNSGTVTIYVDGIASASSSITGTCTSANPLYVGYNGRDNAYITGYLDDIRITKGVARYTANFTPPTSQLQDQ